MQLICKKDLYYLGIKYCTKNKYYECSDILDNNSYFLIKTDVDKLSINKMSIYDYFLTKHEIRLLKMKKIF